MTLSSLSSASVPRHLANINHTFDSMVSGILSGHADLEKSETSRINNTSTTAKSFRVDYLQNIPIHKSIARFDWTLMLRLKYGISKMSYRAAWRYLVDEEWWWPTGRLRWRSGAVPSPNWLSSSCPATGARGTARCRASSPSGAHASARPLCSCSCRCCGTPWNCIACPPSCSAPSAIKNHDQLIPATCSTWSLAVPF